MADVVVLAIKSALAPVQARQAALQAQLVDLERRVQDDALPKELGALRERVAVVESREPTDPAIGELREHIGELASLRERAAVLETRAPIPGPPGPAGLHGKDGADGLGFEDLDIAIEGDRTLVFRFANGDKEHTSRVVVGWPVYQKNWILGQAYVSGDVVTWEGSEWVCLVATDEGQPGVSKAWYRSVTKGARGRDGIDGKDWTPPPVVSVGRPR